MDATLAGKRVTREWNERISLQNWKDAGATFLYKGHSIFFRVGGSPGAEPLVLIHGFPTASWDWEALWPALSKRYRVYTLDMIGFGFSAKPTQYTYSLIDQADLFEALLRQQGVTSYHALAHDYGDTVAQELLARQNETGDRPRLRSLALLNGGLFPETHRPLLTQRLLLSPLGPLIAKLSTRKKFAASMRHIFGAHTQPDERMIDAFWTLLQHNGGLRIMPKLIRYMDERKQHRCRWVGALQMAVIPITLIDGAADPISGAHMAQRYRELLPDPDVTLLEGIGHYPQCEAPQEVTGAYLAFRKRSRTDVVPTLVPLSGV
jgi:pimeloyl-ACP methyl ester carboxylesterase